MTGQHIMTGADINHALARDNSLLTTSGMLGPFTDTSGKQWQIQLSLVPTSPPPVTGGNTTNVLTLSLTGTSFVGDSTLSVVLDGGTPQLYTLPNSAGTLNILAGSAQTSHVVVLMLNNHAYNPVGPPPPQRTLVVSPTGVKWNGTTISQAGTTLAADYATLTVNIPANAAVPLATLPTASTPDAAMPSRMLIGCYTGNANHYLDYFYTWLNLGTQVGLDLWSVHGGESDQNAVIAVGSEMYGPLIQGNWQSGNTPFGGLCLSMPNISDQDSLAACASGALDNMLNQSIANALAQWSCVGQNYLILRMDWEHNNGGMAWRSQGGSGAHPTQLETTFIAAWRRAVGIYRAADVHKKLRIVWCPNVGGDDPFYTYPGDDVVDAIGLDIYDSPGQNGEPACPNPPTSAGDVAAFNYLRSTNFGLDWLVSFGAQHNKPICIPEFGINLDRPWLMLLWLQWGLTNNLFYMNYWQSNAAYTGLLGPDNTRTGNPNQFPNMSAAFKVAVPKIMAGVRTICDANGNPV